MIKQNTKDNSELKTELANENKKLQEKVNNLENALNLLKTKTQHEVKTLTAETDGNHEKIAANIKALDD